MTSGEKIQKIIEALKALPKEKWVQQKGFDADFQTELNGVKVRVFYRINGMGAGVEVRGQLLGTSQELYNDLCTYFKNKDQADREQQINNAYDKIVLNQN